jgi:hypothetical protein
MDPVTLAFLFGGLSAASLPLGAAAGIWLNPSLRVTAAVMAFGAGALLCALVLELVVPALAHFPDDPTTGFVWLALGAMIGCLLFISLDLALSGMGGYLRKHSTISSRLKRRKKQHFHQILDKFFRIIHVFGQITKCHLRFHHPELGGMPAGVGVFRPERGAERVDIS